MLADTDTDMQGPLHAGVAALSLEHDVTTLVGEAADVDPAEAQATETLFFKPDAYLCGHLLSAIDLANEQGAPIAVMTDSGSIVVCTDKNVAIAGMSETTLRWLASVRLPASSVTLRVDPEGCPGEPENMELRRGSNALLWMTMLWAARGRVPEGTSLNTPVRLTGWPNMTRLLLFPHCLRISALWAEKPVSLLETARLLGIPQRFVFSFYSAAYALGLVETVGEAPPVEEAPDARQPVAQPAPASVAAAVADEPEPEPSAAPEPAPRSEPLAVEADESDVAVMPTRPSVEVERKSAPAPAPAPARTAEPVAELETPQVAPTPRPASVARAGSGVPSRPEAAPVSTPAAPTPAATTAPPVAEPVSDPAPVVDSEEERLDHAIKSRNERLRRLREQQSSAHQELEEVEKKGAVSRFFGAFARLFRH